MIKTRVIPVLLWDGMNCVQTVKFGRPARVFGSLMDAVRLYERRNVDELILLDISGKDEPLCRDALRYTKDLFCPITIGGGIRTIDHIRMILRAGADKVAIRTAATPEFIEAAAKKFGSQAIVYALDADLIMPGSAVSTLARRAERHGAGEVLLTSIDRNGTMQGYDTDLIDFVVNGMTSLSIPLIAHGGCGKPEHMLEAIKAGAHAVAASTMFLFTETTPRDCSKYLAEHGIATRVT